jgi:hypothetical protein
LKIKIKNSQGVIDLMAYNQEFEALTVDRLSDKDSEQFLLDATLPNKLIIKITVTDGPISPELFYFSLAGIEVKKAILPRCIDYKIVSNDVPITSLNQLYDFPSENTLQWINDGYVIVDLFHANPIAWHLYIGNKIDFK